MDLGLPWTRKTGYRRFVAAPAHQGYLFSYTLTPTRLWLKLFRLIPLASVNLSRVQAMRRAGAGDYWGGKARGLTRLWRNWYWPYPIDMLGSVSSVMFLLEIETGTRVFVRLAPGIHYKMRDAINNARLRVHGENAHSQPVTFPARR